MSDRQQRILDAAIHVLGTRGVRHLTHRAVDEQADLPLGSTSNRFRTREALLAGVLDRILELEIAAWGNLGFSPPSVDVATFATVVGRFVQDLADGNRVLTLARHAVFVEAANHPELRSRIVESSERLTQWATPLVAALGLPDPPAGLRLLLSLIDGLLVNQLANPVPDFDPTAAIATLLRGSLAGLRVLPAPG